MMLKIFEFLWSGCWHDWKPTGRYSEVFWNGPDTFMGHSYEFECEKCGRRKMVRD